MAIHLVYVHTLPRIATGQCPLEHPVTTGHIPLLTHTCSEPSPVLGSGEKMSQTQSQPQRAEDLGPGDKQDTLGNIRWFQHLGNLSDFLACGCPLDAFWVRLGAELS